MKVLIDGDEVVISCHVLDLEAIARGMHFALKRSSSPINGGITATPRDIAISKLLIKEAQRALAIMSQVGRESATLLDDHPVSEPDSRERVISISKAAPIIGVDARQVYRLLKRDALLIACIVSDHPLRLDRLAVEAYARDRPKIRSAA